MRPIQLTISAFGPYAGRIELPMHQLGEKGLYLILISKRKHQIYILQKKTKKLGDTSAKVH